MPMRNHVSRPVHAHSHAQKHQHSHYGISLSTHTHTPTLTHTQTSYLLYIKTLSLFSLTHFLPLPVLSHTVTNDLTLSHKCSIASSISLFVGNSQVDFMDSWSQWNIFFLMKNRNFQLSFLSFLYCLTRDLLLYLSPLFFTHLSTVCTKSSFQNKWFVSKKFMVLFALFMVTNDRLAFGTAFIIDILCQFPSLILVGNLIELLDDRTQIHWSLFLLE